MLYQISDGSTVDIVLGQQIICRPGFLPKQFDDVAIEVLDLDSQGPKAQLEPGQLSVISPQIIERVIS